MASRTATGTFRRPEKNEIAHASKPHSPPPREFSCRFVELDAALLVGRPLDGVHIALELGEVRGPSVAFDKERRRSEEDESHVQVPSARGLGYHQFLLTKVPAFRCFSGVARVGIATFRHDTANS
jgi:hypothetical protein